MFSVHVFFAPLGAIRLLLEGDYKGKRMNYFKNGKEIEDAQKEIVKVLKKIIINIARNREY